ncbi:hypothetical protein AA0Z99_03150 [Agrococcus sp. 1P02AA]|uniref:DUF6492 family protein n=1 Tax=Agrococcus sp. 1P02AA TaxID=3132259 RepID=UPI0039A52363
MTTSSGATEARGDAQLTFVTVVFEPELGLLRLQARSMARFLDPECVAALIVLDNCAGGMPARAQRSVRSALGPVLGARVRFVRTAELGVLAQAQGWRSQQAAKLLIARSVDTRHLVVLDAKNHLIAPAGADAFVDGAGRPRGGTHPYRAHPLRADLERTLRYLGASDAVVEAALDDFPPTSTPFVLDVELARAMLDDVEHGAGRSFAEEFERAQLLEFFLYSGWSILRAGRAPVTGEPIPAPIVWPGRADVAGARAAIAEAERTGAAWFAVHRRVLARADRAALALIVEFWSSRGLMSTRDGASFVRRFRAAFVPSMLRSRLAQRVASLRSR